MDNRKRRRLTGVSIGIALLIVGAIMLIILFQTAPRGASNENATTASTNNTTTTSTEDDHNNGTTQTATMVPKKTDINVISAKSAFPFVQRWVAQYNNEQTALASVQVSYLQEGNTMTGADMAITGDVSAKSDNNNLSQNYYIPLSAQAAAVVYNLPGFPDIPTGLKLDADTLSRVFNGNITKWNDPAIMNLNQNVNLPKERIVVFYEDMQNGKKQPTTLLLERYLSSFGITEWRPTGNSIAMSGPDELASMVRKTPFSIGYVDFSYATQTKMTYAAVANNSSKYIVPSMDSIAQAVNSAIQVQNVSSINNSTGVVNDTIAPPLINSSRLANNSYPIVGFYYAQLSSDYDNNNGSRRNATIDFIKWIIDDSGGQLALQEIQYPPIYAAGSNNSSNQEQQQLLSEYSEAILRSNNNSTKTAGLGKG